MTVSRVHHSFSDQPCAYRGEGLQQI